MMKLDRLTSAFGKGRPALVAFITAGDGDTAANLDALVAGGADVIELGMPFTDPMADGPAIQAANLRSLGAGTKTRDVLLIANEFRDRQAGRLLEPGYVLGDRADGRLLLAGNPGDRDVVEEPTRPFEHRGHPAGVGSRGGEADEGDAGVA
jgi:hypothetical protein